MPAVTSRVKIVAVCLMCCLAAACAKRPPETDPEAVAAYERANDPLEPINRAMFDFNDGFYTYILDPLADGYEFIVPSGLRTMFANFLSNLSEPVRFINNVLQGNAEGAGITAGRFLTNSTIGFAGVADVATQWDMPLQDEDLGQTFAVWGANEGAYVVLPFFGPSSVRDGVGFLGDILMDPVTWIVRDEGYSYLNWARTGSDGLVAYTRQRGDLREVQEQSLDDYAAVRSLIRQQREYEIYNGDPPNKPTVNDPFAEEFEDYEDFPEFEE